MGTASIEMTEVAAADAGVAWPTCPRSPFEAMVGPFLGDAPNGDQRFGNGVTGRRSEPPPAIRGAIAGTAGAD